MENKNYMVSDYDNQAYEQASEYSAHNDEMNLAWQFVSSTDVSVFLTGKAGTGKTTFLRRLRQLMPKRMVVLAPTGVAAINAEGQTIHSFFQLPLGPFVPDAVRHSSKADFKMSQMKKDLIRTLDLLIIDEISMVRADLLDQVDDALRRYRDRTRPFGGVQLLLIGDLMQLSPVAKPDEWALLSQHYDTPYFFSSHALRQLRYVTIELRHIYRQQDGEFINLLADVRNGHLTPSDINKLNARYIPDFRPDSGQWIRLTSHNSHAQQYNEYCLAMLPSALHSFRSEVKGEFPEYSYPADQQLMLKEGAQVMFIKNDLSPAHSYYNGKIGVIRQFAEEYIEVVCDDGRECIRVTPVEWENTKFSLDPASKAIREETVGIFRQYPLRLAWAITIHKSQGLTFDHAVLDVNASFAHGQVYVALSRCRSLEGLVLSSPILPHSIITDSTVNAYIDNALAGTAENVQRLPRMKFEYTLSLLNELYTFTQLENDLKWLTRVVDEYLSRQQPVLLQTLQQAATTFAMAINGVAMRFRSQYTPMMEQYGGAICSTPIEQRIKESAVYFEEKLHEIFDSLLVDAIINVENKKVAEIYNNALTALQNSFFGKCKLFNVLKTEPYTINLYLNLKAKAMLIETGEKKSRKRSRNSKAERGKAQKVPAPQSAPQPEAMEPEATNTKPKKAAKAKKVDTYSATLELYNQGLSAAEIAEKRGYVATTIESHFAKLITRGQIDINDLVPVQRQLAIVKAAKKFTGAYTLTDIKNLLPDDFTFGEIKMTLASI